MFEPISARLASSCSRNGISAVATDQIWVGETSIRSTSFGATVDVLAVARAAEDLRALRACRVFGSTSAFAWAIIVLLLLGGVEVDDLVGDDAVLDHPVRAS